MVAFGLWVAGLAAFTLGDYLIRPTTPSNAFPHKVTPFNAKHYVFQVCLTIFALGICMFALLNRTLIRPRYTYMMHMVQICTLIRMATNHNLLHGCYVFKSSECV
jgi:hypothetical protein